MLLTTSSLLKVVCCMELVSSTVNIFRFLSVSRMFLANLISNLTSRFPLMKQTLVHGICINLSFGTFHVTDNTLWSDDPGCLPCPVLRSSIRSSLYPSCNVNQNYCWCFWRCWCVGGTSVHGRECGRSPVEPGCPDLLFYKKMLTYLLPW